VYTTQLGGEGAFVAFQDARQAARLAADVGTLGRVGSVTGMPPNALLLLSRAAKYDLVVVPAGLPFEPPALLVDETSSSPAAMEAATRAAQMRAARAVRVALLLPLTSLQASLSNAAAGTVARSLKALLLRRLEALFSQQESSGDADGM
jgi:hypothetical protein